MSEKTVGEATVQELKATAWDMATVIENVQQRLGIVRNELAKRAAAEDGAAEPEKGEDGSASA